MSFPTGTEMFQFPAFALKTLCVQVLSTHSVLRVQCSVHGYPYPNTEH